MTHYVCAGECKGESDQPMVCQNESCSLHGHPMVACNCTDGKHEEVLAHSGEEQL